MSMKYIVLTASLLASISSAALAAESGYRDCAMRNLSACQNSNQLVWAEAGKSGKDRAPVQEFHKALAAFISHAPPLYIGKAGFDPAQIA